MSTAACEEPLTVRTVELHGAEAAAAADLLDVLPAPHLEGRAPFAWVRHGEGLVGWGEAARFSVSGPDRFARAVQWANALFAAAAVDDEVGLPGTGPVLFGSFAFADSPSTSVLVLPRVVVGFRDGRAWLTSVGSAPARLPVVRATAPAQAPSVAMSDGALSEDVWRTAVAEAVRRIHAGELSKVVLARDLLAQAESPVDVRRLLSSLAARYPECFTFAVADLVGATPELLIRRVGDQVSSRVLAGTAWPTDPDRYESDAHVAARLRGSSKDREEHRYAALSAAEALRPYCSDLNVPTEPSVLTLRNVAHLATEVTGTLSGDTSALTLAGLLHPTAAVCGTPAAAAARVIADLEGMDRGRYAGPVGWMDARGDGEWGIALRCAQVEGSSLRLFAGCGIVAGSDPDAEAAEAAAKFLAVRESLDAADVYAG
ncbi:MAG: isochorismate synthase [Sporichthyaceae bacterium]